MAKLLEWGSKEGESWYHARSSFLRLLLEKVIVLDYVGRFAGGQYFHRDHRGDPNARTPFVVVDPKLQRKALAFVENSLYKDDFFTFAPDFLNHLAPPRWWHTGTSFNMTYVSVVFPIHEYIGVLQWWQLSDRLSPYTLMRIYDAETQTSDAEKLTAAEYIQRIQECWKRPDPEKTRADAGQAAGFRHRRSLRAARGSGNAGPTPPAPCCRICTDDLAISRTSGRRSTRRSRSRRWISPRARTCGPANPGSSAC
jgi:hypothetical protein